MSNNLALKNVRIDSSEFYSGKTYTIVSAPAPDAFSHPSRFKVQSVQPIGGNGQFVDLEIAVSGMVRVKNYQDKNTGQQKTFNESDVFLEVLNAKPSVQPIPAKQQ